MYSKRKDKQTKAKVDDTLAVCSVLVRSHGPVVHNQTKS